MLLVLGLGIVAGFLFGAISIMVAYETGTFVAFRSRGKIG